MNELEKIKLLDIAINDLRKMSMGIMDNYHSATDEKKAELMRSREVINEKISAMIAKRSALVIDTACSIAGVDTIEL